MGHRRLRIQSTGFSNSLHTAKIARQSWKLIHVYLHKLIETFQAHLNLSKSMPYFTKTSCAAPGGRNRCARLHLLRGGLEVSPRPLSGLWSPGVEALRRFGRNPYSGEDPKKSLFLKRLGVKGGQASVKKKGPKVLSSIKTQATRIPFGCHVASLPSLDSSLPL